MKKYNKVIAAAMMIMAITVSTPAMANNKKEVRPVNPREMRMHHRTAHYGPMVAMHHHPHAAIIRTTAFRASPREVVANMRGVRAVDYNPRTHMMTVVYNARIVSPRHIEAVIY